MLPKPFYAYSAQEAAAYLGRPVGAVYRLAAAGELAYLQTVARGETAVRVVNGKRQVIRVTGRLRFAKADLDAYLARQRVEAVPLGRQTINGSRPQAATIEKTIEDLLPPPGERLFS